MVDDGGFALYPIAVKKKMYCNIFIGLMDLRFLSLNSKVQS